MPETNLKKVLMDLGNRLVLTHGYDPPIATIKALTEFINDCPEARVELRAMGFEWPIAIVPNRVGGTNG